MGFNFNNECTRKKIQRMSFLCKNWPKMSNILYFFQNYGKICIGFIIFLKF